MWLAGWKYRRKITINNSLAYGLSDYQVWLPTSAFSVQWAAIRSSAQPTMADFRFTPSTATSTIPYWIDPDTTTANCRGFWVKMSTLPAVTGTTIYMYYGNVTVGAPSIKVGDVEIPGWSANVIKQARGSTSGVYWLDPDGGATANAFQAYCDMITASGGWIMVYNNLFSGDEGGPTPTQTSSVYGTVGINSDHGIDGQSVFSQIGATKMMVKEDSNWLIFNDMTSTLFNNLWNIAGDTTYSITSINGNTYTRTNSLHAHGSGVNQFSWSTVNTNTIFEYNFLTGTRDTNHYWHIWPAANGTYAIADGVGGDRWGSILVRETPSRSLSQFGGLSVIANTEESAFFSTGTYKSSVIDTTSKIVVSSISWNPSSQPAGTNLAVGIRVSSHPFSINSSTPSWRTVSNGQTLNWHGRYIQYQSTFTTTNSTTTPRLEDISITYRVKPWQEKSVTRTPPNAFGFGGGESWTWQVPVKGGMLVTISAYIRYNTEYQGGIYDRPRLTLSGLGINESISATAGAEGSWEQRQLSGTPSSDGILMLKVEGFSPNPVGKFYVDDINVAQ
jgi:hypothetical protein